jgi:hypothetical protein
MAQTSLIFMVKLGVGVVLAIAIFDVNALFKAER